MLGWLIGFCVLSAVVLLGFYIFREACGRQDRPEGWEDKRVAESGDAGWQKRWEAARDWLSRQETEELEVQSDDGFLLHGLLLPHVNPRATVLLFHGWHSSWEMDFLCLLPFLHKQRLQCLLVDQRAQGDSEGRYMTYGVRERLDVPVWVDYAASRFGKDHPLLLYGVSMGAATVLMASSERYDAKVCGIVADCGFTSPHEIIAKAGPKRLHLPPYPTLWLLELYTRLFADFSLWGANTPDALRSCRCPVLFIHGKADDFVPCEMTQRAYDACASDKTLLLVDGAGHARSHITDSEKYEAAYAAFLDKCIS